MGSLSRSRRGGQHGLSFQIFQGTTLILSVMFITSFHRAAAQRDTNLTWFKSPQPWNKALYKTKRNCIDFRPEITRHRFFYWPEDNALFDHCCSFEFIENEKRVPGLLAADNFTYGDHGPKLAYMTYYDLGLIDELCLPYWKCRHLYDKYFDTVLYNIKCEVTDLLRLYQHRFWHGCVLKYGILESALPAIVSVEVLVLLVALFRVCQQDVVGSKKEFMTGAGKMWVKAVHKAVLIVWIHLVLLAIIGNGLIEAIGRQKAYTSRAKSYYNYARLYIWLSVLVWFSSLTQQASYWIAVVEDSEVQLGQSDRLGRNQTLCRHTSVMTELEGRIGLNADWKWQPIAAQAGILFCMWGFLTYFDDEDSVASGLFGVIVQAAAPWSGLYAVKIIFNTLPFLLMRMYKGVSCFRWRRRGSQCTQGDGLEDPGKSAGWCGIREVGVIRRILFETKIMRRYEFRI